MKTIFHAADSRGKAEHGWLKSRHTFSFAEYNDAERVHFGALRVLNDDQVAPGMGFGKHPHRDMEIISIPLSGDLEHQDNMGNEGIIRRGDIQVMSAGTGVVHSEKNKNHDQEVRFLQIWIIPEKQGVSPRYDQLSLQNLSRENEIYQILSPNKEDAGVWIHQQAWFDMGELKSGWKGSHQLRSLSSGLYVFLIEGQVQIGDITLNKRDGLGITEASSVEISVLADCHILLIEVPMNIF